MNFQGKKGQRNRQNVIEYLQELSKFKGGFRFDSMTWDEEKPVLKLKGYEETPDFTITFGTKGDSFITLIVPDKNPELMRHSTKVCPRSGQLAGEIWQGCLEILTGDLCMYSYVAKYRGRFGWLKVIPPSQIKYTAVASLRDYLLNKNNPEYLHPLIINLDANSSVRILPKTGKPMENYGSGTIQIETDGVKKQFFVDQVEHCATVIAALIYCQSADFPDSMIAA